MFLFVLCFYKLTIFLKTVVTLVYENNSPTKIDFNIFIMRTFIAYIPLILCMFAQNQTVLAQEEIVAFDSQNTIFKLTPEIEQKINLYKGDGKFIEAELFKQVDSSFIIEFHFKIDEKIFRERKPMTFVEVTNMRQKVDSVVAVPTETTDAMEGRGFLLAASLLSGVTTYGPGIVSMINSSNDRLNIGIYMLGAGSCFFVPFFTSRNKPVSYGQANMVYYGLSRGFAHGVLTGLCIAPSDSNHEAQIIASSGVIMGLSEAFIGYHLVRNLHISNGNANLMTVYGDFGFYAGLGVAVQCRMIENEQGRAIAAFTAAGALLSEATGYYVGKKYPVSAGDAEIIYTTGILGGFLPLWMINLANPKHPADYITPTVITGAAGMFVGHKLMNDKNFSFTQGFITKIGTVAGGLVGCGLTYLVLDSAKAWHFLLGSYLGAQASFYLLYKINKSMLNIDKLNNIGFRIMPENYFLSRQAAKKNPYIQGFFPLAQLNYKF